MRPVSLSLTLVCAALQLPHAILDPALDTGSKLATKTGKEDEEFEE
jgi:hypothetical protein